MSVTDERSYEIAFEPNERGEHPIALFRFDLEQWRKDIGKPLPIA